MARDRRTKCQTWLLVDTEVNRNYPGGAALMGFNAGGRALDYVIQRQNDVNASGVSCAACGGQNSCVKCMKTHRRSHPSSGGPACLSCGGHLQRYVG